MGQADPPLKRITAFDPVSRTLGSPRRSSRQSNLSLDTACHIRNAWRYPRPVVVSKLFACAHIPLPRSGKRRLTPPSRIPISPSIVKSMLPTTPLPCQRAGRREGVGGANGAHDALRIIRYLFSSTSSPIIQETLERAAGERHAQAIRAALARSLTSLRPDTFWAAGLGHRFKRF